MLPFFLRPTVHRRTLSSASRSSWSYAYRWVARLRGLKPTSVLQLSLCAWILVASTARAELTTPQKETRARQLQHLERITETRSLKADEKKALLGMLILRDEEPDKTAGCQKATENASDTEFHSHLLACPRCRDITELARKGVTTPTLTPRPPSRRIEQLLCRAERLVDDGYGYVPNAEELGPRLSRALRLLDGALVESPDEPHVLQLYGTLKEVEGDSATAELAFKKAINLRPRYATALHNFALLQMRAELYEHAHHVLRFALWVEPDYPTARLLARLYATSAPRGLVSRTEAIRLMRWVVREERSPAQLAADHDFLQRLTTRSNRNQEILPWRR